MLKITISKFILIAPLGSFFRKIGDGEYEWKSSNISLCKNLLFKIELITLLKLENLKFKLNKIRSKLRDLKLKIR